MSVKQGGGVYVSIVDILTLSQTEQLKNQSLIPGKAKRYLSIPRYPEQLWCQLFKDIRSPFFGGKAAR
jgi:hypothetical protein